MPKPSPESADIPRWNGRLSVRVDATESLASQSFSSTFELQGKAEQGQLHFYTPLGSTAAVIVWTGEQASLTSGSDVQSFRGIDALIARVLGTTVPVSALFAWLAGDPASPDGWQVDQSQFASGKITARRTSPAPQAEIRVILEP
ncbi:MAG TPA: lipoprotein insertase outer membrane protein LolB [Pseudomonas sp.]|nr:lipoprotein insertase outer membrane protein LolB [Pseudomonas sp.]